MSFELYTAFRLTNGKKCNTNSSLSLSLLTIIGVALSVSVMLLSVSIIRGFKKEIRSYVYSQTGHISIFPSSSSWLDTNKYISISDSLYSFFKSNDIVSDIYPIVQGTSILKTKNNFEGISIIGFQKNNIPEYYKNRIPKDALRLDNKDNYPPIILPHNIASRLGYKNGDKVIAYFQDNRGGVMVRAFNMIGTYRSVGTSSAPAISNIKTLQSIKGYSNNEYSRLLIMFSRNENISNYTNRFVEYIKLNGEPYLKGEVFGMNTAQEMLPNIFNWLDVIDTNVYFLLVIMILVSGFTMVTGLIIIVLDKNIHIAILKSIGASNKSIRNIFIILSIKLALKGIGLGNIIYAFIFFIQNKYKLLSLDAKTYYMDYVPLSFNLYDWIIVNIISLIVIVLFTVYPTRIINKILPNKSLRVE